MPEHCTCGAELPPDARFCHRCGKPQREEPLIAAEAPQAPPRISPPEPPLHYPEISFRNPAAVRTGFLAALFANLLTFLVYFGCPLWLVGAGILAVRLYRRVTGQKLTVNSGARLGWITGLLTFTIFTVMFTISFVLTVRAGAFEKATRESLENLPFAQGNVDAIVQMLNSPVGMAMNLLVSLFVMFVVFAVFGMMGGALGAKWSGRDAGQQARP